MHVVTYMEFRNNLDESLNKVNNDCEIVLVSRSNGKNIVIMPMEQYNAIQETFYLSSSRENRKRLDEAIKEMKKRKSYKERAEVIK